MTAMSDARNARAQATGISEEMPRRGPTTFAAGTIQMSTWKHVLICRLKAPAVQTQQLAVMRIMTVLTRMEIVIILGRVTEVGFLVTPTVVQ
jgi:ribosomal protein L18E